MPNKAGHRPERMCVVCRGRFPKEELLRHVCPLTPEETGTGGLVPDPGQKLPGRGFYICGRPECRARFEKVARGLKKKCKGEAL